MTQADADFDPLKWPSTGTGASIRKYMRANMAGPGIPLLVVWAIVLLTLAICLLWRCIRCLCIVCCQQVSFGDGEKIFAGWRLRKWKVNSDAGDTQASPTSTFSPNPYALSWTSLLILMPFPSLQVLLLASGLVVCGMGTWGMVSLPPHFLSTLWPVVNQFLAFGSTLLYGIDQVGYLTGNLSVPLTNLTNIMAHDVNPQAIKSNLIKVCTGPI
jgi:hypothetical protein